MNDQREKYKLDEEKKTKEHGIALDLVKDELALYKRKDASAIAERNTLKAELESTQRQLNILNKKKAKYELYKEMKRTQERDAENINRSFDSQIDIGEYNMPGRVDSGEDSEFSDASFEGDMLKKIEALEKTKEQLKDKLKAAKKETKEKKQRVDELAN